MKFSEIQPGKTVIYNGKHLKIKVEVIGIVDGLRTKVVVKEIDRGPGWDEQNQSYKGVRVLHGWYRGQNYSYGQQYEVHRKYLELCN